MGYDLLVKNGRILKDGRLQELDIYINDGKIADVKKSSKKEKAAEVIDAKKRVILPGLIDSHVHFREPGQTKKEDWVSGSKAAAAGGVTTVLDMPNNSPSIVSEKNLKEKRRIAQKKSFIDFGFHFGATKENMGELEKIDDIASVKFYLGSSTGPLLMDDPVINEKYFSALKEKNIPATIHAEDEQMVSRLTALLSKKPANRLISVGPDLGKRLHLQLRKC
ncbi:MAG: dihydroorotase family protein [Candidatus Altiarchaeota archaeon]